MNWDLKLLSGQPSHDDITALVVAIHALANRDRGCPRLSHLPPPARRYLGHENPLSWRTPPIPHLKRHAG